MNNSGLHPLGHAVLVEPYEPEVKKSMIELPSAVKERTSMVETRAVVIEIGAMAWEEEKEPRAKIGDTVLIQKFAGVMAVGVLDGKPYRLINDRDIFCRLEEK
jgi:co-chaperonin GroES (HSP10)